MTEIMVSQLRLTRGRKQQKKKDRRREAKGMSKSNTLYSKYFWDDGTPKNRRLKQQ